MSPKRIGTTTKGMVPRRRLATTGLEVSALGLGSGGSSMLGHGYNDRAEILALVRNAYEIGINFFDTAPTYKDTEKLLGLALEGLPRSTIVVSTKFAPVLDGRLRSRADLRSSLTASLARLRLDYVDILFLHGVPPSSYDAVLSEFGLEIQQIRADGLVSNIGISEAYAIDHSHETLKRSLEERVWDVVMVGLNVLSPSAGLALIPDAVDKGVGVITMCAVRSVLSDQHMLKSIISGWVSEGLLSRMDFPPDDPLRWLREETGLSVVDAAYCFAANFPGVAGTLSGTGNLAHLTSNARAVSEGRLSPRTVEKILQYFGPIQHNVGPPS